MTELPDKPSELIRLALQDLEKAEESDHYEVYMEDWHAPSGKICTVCLAGAVMAFSLRSSRLHWLQPADFEYPYCLDETVKGKLQALDCFRVGDVRDALGCMDLRCNTIGDQKITPYEKSAECFKADMKHLASLLEQAGL